MSDRMLPPPAPRTSVQRLAKKAIASIPGMNKAPETDAGPPSPPLQGMTLQDLGRHLDRQLSQRRKQRSVGDRSQPALRSGCVSSYRTSFGSRASGGDGGRMSHGRFRAHSDASEAPSRAPRSERASRATRRPINIRYYHDAAMKSKWCRDAERSDDWRLKMQVKAYPPPTHLGLFTIAGLHMPAR